MSLISKFFIVLEGVFMILTMGSLAICFVIFAISTIMLPKEKRYDPAIGYNHLYLFFAKNKSNEKITYTNEIGDIMAAIFGFIGKIVVLLLINTIILIIVLKINGDFNGTHGYKEKQNLNTESIQKK